MAKAEKRRRGIYVPPYDHSPVTRAILQGGYEWEQQVIEDKIAGKVHIAPGSGDQRVTERTFEVRDSLRRLADMKSGEYIYQATLKAPPSFYEDYNLNPNEVSFGQCRPDLIQRLPGRRRAFRVIDVKASDALKTSHKVQTCLYALILQHVLGSEGIAGELSYEDSAIWLYGTDAPEVFDEEPIRLYVMEFLRVELPRITSCDPVKAPWHLNYRCEWCEYFEHCREEAEKAQSVSLVPYLTTAGRSLLRDSGVDTLTDLARFLKRADAPSILDGSATLGGQEERLGYAVSALTTGEVVASGGATPVMPRGENVRVVLTLQREPVSGLTYAAGLLRTGSNEVFSADRYDERQFVASCPDECEDVRRDFVLALYEIFQELDDYNATHSERKDKKSLQTYVFDSYEADLLRQLLLDALSDPDVAEEALALLFHFQSEDLMSAEEHPDETADSPLVVITPVIRRLFQMPVAAAYRLGNVLAAFNGKDSGDAFNYKADDYWDFALSNRLKSDAIFDVWYRGKSDFVLRIQRRLRTRLWATRNVVDRIRDQADNLFAWPPKFRMPVPDDFGDPALSRLAFMTRYESVMGYLSIRNARTLTRLERERAGTTVPVVAAGANVFVATSPEIEQLVGGWRLLLTEDSEEGEMAQMRFADYAWRNRFGVPGKAALAFAEIGGETEVEDDRYRFALKIKPGPGSPKIVPGRRYLLHPAFTDFNTDRVIERLREIDQADPASVTTVLTSPHSLLGPRTALNGPVRKEIERLLKRREWRDRFTDSQLGALNHIVDNQLTLVWGPPGTGKTHFLALAVLTLLEAATRAGEPMRVLVTAFTHAAIENCLRKMDSLRQDLSMGQEDAALVKLGLVYTQGCEGIDCIDPDRTAEFIKCNEQCVVGGTVYSMLKAFKARPGSRPFDVVVIDEGSQVKVAESLLAISRLAPKGRLVIAGDDKQLPPIINGVYPELGPDEPLLHRSVFEAVREHDSKANAITCQLLENFRMNTPLCSFSAECLYGPDYRSANERVGQRKMPITAPHSAGGPARRGRASSRTERQWVETVVDPAYSWTMCVLEDVQTGAANWAEAELVAELTWELRSRLKDERTNRPFPNSIAGDAAFWQRGLFIVSPHHAQISAIKQELDKRKLRAPYFVDTVDKMQGQECEAVIVSYGLADPECAMIEGEFIYSLNRFNVAVTRAKSKCIVFVPRPLLRPCLSVLENPETAMGAGMMHKLEMHTAAGQTLDFTVKCDMYPEGTRLAVYRR